MAKEKSISKAPKDGAKCPALHPEHPERPVSDLPKWGKQCYCWATKFMLVNRVSSRISYFLKGSISWFSPALLLGCLVLSLFRTLKSNLRAWHRAVKCFTKGIFKYLSPVCGRMTWDGRKYEITHKRKKCKDLWKHSPTTYLLSEQQRCFTCAQSAWISFDRETLNLAMSTLFESLRSVPSHLELRTNSTPDIVAYQVL